MKEIGSEFWDVPVGEGNNIFPGSVQWFLSGRSALQAIIKDLKGAETALLPSWCCESMVKPFADAGIKVRFYPVYPMDTLVQEIKPDCDILFIMDYFGYGVSREPEHPCVIRDVTHSIFSPVRPGADYYFGSLRKWCGVWTGGFAWTRDGRSLEAEDVDNGYVALRETAMRLKSRYMDGPADNEGQMAAEKGFLEIFEKAEKKLQFAGPAKAAKRDVFLAGKLDVGFIKSRRRANAKLLMDVFKDWLIFRELQDGDCPMFVPVLVPDGKRDELRNYLIKNGIYCPVHWPVSRFHKLNEKTEVVYKNELSLVCDQRYTEEDMRRMAGTIIRFFG